MLTVAGRDYRSNRDLFTLWKYYHSGSKLLQACFGPGSYFPQFWTQAQSPLSLLHSLRITYIILTSNQLVCFFFFKDKNMCFHVDLWSYVIKHRLLLTVNQIEFGQTMN